MAPRVDVRVLGRPHVVVDDAIAPVVGRQLILTLRLALADHAALTLGRLVEDVWTGGAGTEGAARVALTRLRNALGHDAVVHARTGTGWRRTSASMPIASNSSWTAPVIGRSRSVHACASSTRRWPSGGVRRSTTSIGRRGSMLRRSASTSSASRPSTCASSCGWSSTIRHRWSRNCAPRSTGSLPASGASRCWRSRCIGRDGSLTLSMSSHVRATRFATSAG